MGAQIIFFLNFEILILIGCIPDFNDIPKTMDTFWKDTTKNKLKYGFDGGGKVKVYKHPGSSFILYQDEDNNECIYNLQQDGTIQDGIFRSRDVYRNTAIGSEYFRRSWKEYYRFYRLNKSRDIKYYDIIDGKSLARYSFNTETLDWTNLDY